MGLTDDELINPHKITKAKWSILTRTNLKILVTWDGHNQKKTDV